MSLAFECIDARADRYAAGPTLAMKLRITERTGAKIHSIMLRCQLRIEPTRRHYTADEAQRLLELFGETPQWGDSLKPMQLATVPLMVPGFTGSREIELPVPFSYDFEVATSKYFHGLEDGEIPLLLLFSGTVFTATDTGYHIEQISWECEDRYRLPVTVWREMMDAFFPGGGWIRLHRDTLDALQLYKARNALPSWEHAFEALLKQAGEDVR